MKSLNFRVFYYLLMFSVNWLTEHNESFNLKIGKHDDSFSLQIKQHYGFVSTLKIMKI